MGEAAGVNIRRGALGEPLGHILAKHRAEGIVIFLQRVRKHRGIAQGTPLLGSALSVSGLARLVNPGLVDLLNALVVASQDLRALRGHVTAKSSVEVLLVERFGGPVAIVLAQKGDMRICGFIGLGRLGRAHPHTADERRRTGKAQDRGTKNFHQLTPSVVMGCSDVAPGLSRIDGMGTK